MNQIQLFLPCAAGVEDYLAQEVHEITGLQGEALRVMRGGVTLQSSWRDALRLNLYSRLCQRVLVQLHVGEYRHENDLYEAASQVAWEIWFTPKESFKIEITAQHSPLQSLNFAALKIKDAIADRFRFKTGIRPDVNTQWPDARIYAHLTTDTATIYIDTSGEPLFKRGWRQDTGEAPLKETLAAAMIAASGWVDTIDEETGEFAPFYDPCCGSGTIAIEAAQIACNIAPGSTRRFGFEKLLPFQPHVWDAIKNEASQAVLTPAERTNIQIFGSDVSFRMVDFATRNAERAGVADVIQFRGGDALQRMPPCDNEKKNGIMIVNPPYGDRIGISGVAGQNARRSGGRENAQQPGQQNRRQSSHQNAPDNPDAGDFEQDDRSGQADQPRFGQRETAQTDNGDEFFPQLATHWKKNYAGWSAYVLTPDMKLPTKMRLKESRRVPMWNGPIECRLFRFDMVAGSARTKPVPP